MKQIAVAMVLAFALVTGAAAMTVTEATIFAQAALADGSGSSSR